MSARTVGASVKRIDDLRLVTGQGRYVDDIELPGMLEIAFVRSSEAHALIRSIDVSAARALPGVVAVWTLADLGGDAQKPMVQAYPHPSIEQDITQYPLAKDEVCFVGQTIVLVAARNRYIAEDAAQLVEVEYEPLPVVIDARAAARPDSPLVHRGARSNLAGTLEWKFGDAARAFARAEHVFRESYFEHRGGSQSMEGRAVLAQFDAGTDQLTVWTSTQSPFLVRRHIAAYLGREETGIRVITPDVGGGFGPKAAHYPEELLMAIAALKLGQPVKWTGDRRENFLATNQQRDQWWDVEVACDASGKVLALRAQCIHDNGAYLPYGMLLPLSSVFPFPGAYAIPAVDVSLKCMFTNAVPCSSIRGAGRPNVVFVLERTMDCIARKLGLDRVAVRLVNFIRKDQFPYETGARMGDGIPVVYDSGDYAGCLEMVMKSAGYSSFETKRAAAAQQGRRIGLGIASYNEDTGAPPYEGATVRVLPSGRIYAELGTSSQGQGLETVIAQVVADQFGVEPKDVIVKTGDTATTAMALSTVGSRATSTAGPSALLAAMQVREKAIRLAAHRLEVAEHDLDITDGEVHVLGVRERAVPLGDLAKQLHSNITFALPPGFTPGLEATSYFTSQRPVYANGSVMAEVEVDVQTGEIRLLDYWVAHDCGKRLNPSLVDGQIYGGVVHGIGNALFEHMKYDRETGQPVTTNFGEYLLPLATEMPPIHIEHMETPSPVNPLGVKGAGEGGTIPAIACMVSAVEDALKPFGVQLNEFPIFPERLLELIDRKEPGEPRGSR